MVWNPIQSAQHRSLAYGSYGFIPSLYNTLSAVSRSNGTIAGPYVSVGSSPAGVTLKIETLPIVTVPIQGIPLPTPSGPPNVVSTWGFPW